METCLSARLLLPACHSSRTMQATLTLLSGFTHLTSRPPYHLSKHHHNLAYPSLPLHHSPPSLPPGGDDFKSGQTKMKSVLVDFLVGAGIKPTSIVSYNHLGNNDGMNLSAPQTFRSKEISKSNVVDDMVQSNEILYGWVGGVRGSSAWVGLGLGGRAGARDSGRGAGVDLGHSWLGGTCFCCC